MSIYTTGIYASLEMQTVVTASTTCHRSGTTANSNVLQVAHLFSLSLEQPLDGAI